MASIDWEDLLGAEGDGLQDAYDEAVAAWSGYDLDEEEEERRENIRARRRLSLYRGVDGGLAERNAVRKALEKCFHTKFNWIVFGQVKNESPTGEKTTPCLWDEEVKRIVMTDAMGRIVLLSKRDSGIFFYGYQKDYNFNWDCIADGWNRRVFQDSNVYNLKYEYDADGMPLRVYGCYHEVYDDYGYYEEIKRDNYTVWSRPTNEDTLTWVFEKIQNEGELILRPVELWDSNYVCVFKLIWEKEL